MSAPLRHLDANRDIPRYLNADLTLNMVAITQAARCEAQGRVENNDRARRYLAAHRLSPVAPLTFEDAFRRALARYSDIAAGMRASELHFRGIELAEFDQPF